jgi:RNA polymerase sigma-70 factor, ECF subfamily
MEEIELVERLKSNDNEAFKWLVTTYRQKVAATCYGFTGDYEASLDLAQDVFVEVYKSISNFRGDSKLSTWIFRISTNKSINWLRDNKKHRFSKSIQRFFKSEDPELQIKSNNRSDGLGLLIQTDDEKVIQEALDKLPESQKTAFVLNKIDDLSYKEVAEIMDVTLATVESLIFRARKKLQNHLQDYYKNYN